MVKSTSRVSNRHSARAQKYVSAIYRVWDIEGNVLLPSTPHGALQALTVSDTEEQCRELDAT